MVEPIDLQTSPVYYLCGVGKRSITVIFHSNSLQSSLRLGFEFETNIIIGAFTKAKKNKLYSKLMKMLMKPEGAHIEF